jgi:hypothetical protein
MAITPTRTDRLAVLLTREGVLQRIQHLNNLERSVAFHVQELW